MLFNMITMLFSTAIMANQNQTQEINKFLGSRQIRKKSEENSEFHGGFKIDLTEALNDSHTSYEDDIQFQCFMFVPYKLNLLCLIHDGNF